MVEFWGLMDDTSGTNKKAKPENCTTHLRENHWTQSWVTFSYPHPKESLPKREGHFWQSGSYWKDCSWECILEPARDTVGSKNDTLTANGLEMHEDNTFPSECRTRPCMPGIQWPGILRISPLPWNTYYLQSNGYIWRKGEMGLRRGTKTVATTHNHVEK